MSIPMLEIHKKIYNIFKSSLSTSNADEVVFHYSVELEQSFKQLEIEVDVIKRENTITVLREHFPIDVYLDFKSYLKLNQVKSDNVLIVNLENNPFSYISDITYCDFEMVDENYFFSNAKGYVDFLEFLKNNDVDSEEAFHFIDYYNDLTRRIVLTSLSDKGRVIIKFYNEIESFNSAIDYRIALGSFKNCFSEESHHLPKFLKSALIEYSTRFDNDKRIYMLFENLHEITNKAKVNFEIYLNGLSIDKIVKEYDDYKAKYFKELSDILNNLTQKMIGLPLVISTALFAVEQAKKSNIILAILIVALTATNIYMVLLLRINFKDLKYIKYLSNKDYKTLTNNNFFKKHPNELDAFSMIKQRISLRITNLKVISESYYWMLGVSNMIIIGLIINYLGIKLEVILILGLVVLFVLAMIRNSILKNFDDEEIFE